MLLALPLVFKSKTRLNRKGLARRRRRARMWEKHVVICSIHTMRASRGRPEQNQVVAARLAVCFGSLLHRWASCNHASRLETLMHVADTCSSMRDCRESLWGNPTLVSRHAPTAVGQSLTMSAHGCQIKPRRTRCGHSKTIDAAVKCELPNKAWRSTPGHRVTVRAVLAVCAHCGCCTPRKDWGLKTPAHKVNAKCRCKLFSSHQVSTGQCSNMDTSPLPARTTSGTGPDMSTTCSSSTTNSTPQQHKNTVKKSSYFGLQSAGAPPTQQPAAPSPPSNRNQSPHADPAAPR